MHLLQDLVENICLYVIVQIMLWYCVNKVISSLQIFELTIFEYALKSILAVIL